MILLVLTLLDGSSLNMQVKADYLLEFKSPYGTLKFPVSELLDADIGAHVDNEKTYLDNQKQLGSGEFKDRDAATRFFKKNPYAGYRYLLAAKSGTNFEAKNRAEALLKEYEVTPPQNDVANLVSQKLTGQFITPGIKCHSEHLGDLTISMSSIKSLYAHQPIINTKITYGAWQTVTIARGKVMRISARGSIDMWPQAPGQYITGPEGLATMKDNHPGGALIGRINHGNSFLIGNSFSGNLGTGELEVRINPSPWDSGTVSGEYEFKLEQ